MLGKLLGKQLGELLAIKIHQNTLDDTFTVKALFGDLRYGLGFHR
ncbi:hypothetical protein [Moraxella caviae]|nr:hypothetical protein [Moraxella caviae]